jgi:hypothetical protein
MDRPTLTRWVLLLCFLAGSVDAGRTRSAAVQSLGRIVYLPNVNSQNNHHVSAPFIFDAENLLDLAETSKIEHTDHHSMWFECSEQLKKEIAREWGIKGTYREMCFTVESEFERLVGDKQKEVTAAEVHAVRLHSKTRVPKGSNLNDFPLKGDFKNDFRKLPTNVKDAHEDRAWMPFRDFMKKWGSHIVDTAYTGAMFQSWSSAGTSHGYKREQMEARACLKAEGKKGNGALEVCTRYDEHEREAASRLSGAFDTKRIRGGTKDTRSKLEREMVTKDLIEHFLKEDHADEQPVWYEYMPVWEFLLERCDRGSDDEKRALGLQAYYEGWLENGCPLVTTNGQANNNAQMMVPEYTKEKKPTGHYLCIRRCHGCHDYNNDCHFEVAQACCRAYGPSALRPVAGGYVIHAHDYDSGWCGDNGCQYSVGSGCHCEKSNQEEGCNYKYPLNPDDPSLKYKVIWNQHDSHRPRETFDSMLAMEK